MLINTSNKFLYLFVVLFLIVGGQFINVSANPGESITVHFTNMNPHVGGNFYIRAVDKGTLKESFGTGFNLTNPDFDVVIPVTKGKSYLIDFFADLNGNDLYDAPPTDHAWRIDADNVTNGQEFNFAHNTNFTDIDWPYIVTINFSGMAPHIGQMLEIRLEDDNTGKEVDRIKLNTIPAADFNVIFVGVKLGVEYKIEFYADLNGNGLYDAPPTDHAWMIPFENMTGDVSLDFTHNTNFTDINWKYLLTVNLMGMVPHVAQLFELRVVDNNNQNEISRVTLDQILVPDFSVFLDGIEIGHDYNIDFYSDLNGNGGYDVPPTDHAWRLTFNAMDGDFIQKFTHNTNFTDIQWPPLTSVEDDLFAAPKSYTLFQNYPNPFNPSTDIKFNLEESGFVTLKVYDILGNEVAELVKGNLEKGIHEVSFDASAINSGVYLYRLEANNFSQVKKMTLLK
jgi:Secretion system C-terminal sorting domain